MFIIIPEDWECDLQHETAAFRRSADPSDNHDRIRSALLNGEKLFLIGVEGICGSNRYVAATDHISLFGSSPLIGQNRDDLGPRFPSLMGLYIAPEGSWDRGIAGRVPDWKLATPAELKLLGAEVLVSAGIDEAEIAGHAGANVVLLIRCHSWESMNMQHPPLQEAAEAAVSLYNLKFTEGGEEQ